MIDYRIEFAPAAYKQFRNLSQRVRERLWAQIIKLEKEPRPPGVKKLKGSDDRWRIRVGDYRMVYTIIDNEVLITIIRIDHRRSVYR